MSKTVSNNGTTAQSHTTRKALSVIETLAEAGGAGYISLIELSKRTEMDKATVYRILNTLIDLGYIEKSDAKYRLTLRLLDLAMNTARNKSLTELARPHLLQLANETGERAFLAVLDGNEVVQIDKVEGNPSIRVVSEIGSRFPVHCTSSGKVFLAYLPAEKIDRLLEPVPLAPCTDRTAESLQQLRKEIDLVRSTGFAESNGEYRDHERSLAAPLVRGESEIVASLGVAGTTMTLTDSKRELVIARLVDHAHRLSAALQLVE